MKSATNSVLQGICTFPTRMLHLFQISRHNWPTEKVSGSLFSCQVQSLFLSSKRKCTVIQGGFSIVEFIKKVVRQYKIISWCIQGHFEQFLNLCMTYCLANIPQKDHSKERYGELLWGKKEGKDIVSVCVNSEAPKTFYIKQACQHFFTMA